MVAIPEHILANWRQWYGADAEPIATDMEKRLLAAADSWDLRDLRTMEGGEVAWIVEATRDRSPVVCKLSPADPNLAGEASALASWGGLCPELLGVRDRGTTMLMPRLNPGGTLLAAGASVDDQLRVVGALAWRIHRAPPPEVPRLADSKFAVWWLDALPNKDRDELRELLEADGVVIHNDLHAGNVLDDGGRWVAIDPKPFRAMPEAEIWGVIDEAGLTPGRERAEMSHRLELYCEAAGLDRGLARRWARLRATAEALLVTERSQWRRELELVADALDA